MQKISLQKRSFFNSIGLDIKKLPQELKTKTCIMQRKLPKEDLIFFSNKKLPIIENKHFRLKNLIGTINIGYENKTWIEIFINNEKCDEIIKQYFKNPNYYFKELRKLDQSNLNHNNELVLYEDNGKFFVKDGVARLSLMMVKYLLEMSRAQSKEERLIINKQYTFAANVIAIPKDRDIVYLINMLIEIYGSKIKIQRANSVEECNYNIQFEEKAIEVKNKKELEILVKNSYFPKEYKNIDILKNKIVNLLKIGIEYKENEENEESFLVMGKIFPNYEVFIKYYNKLKKYDIENKIYEKLDLENVTYESILKRIIKFVKNKEKDMEEKTIKKVKKQKVNKKEASKKEDKIKLDEKEKNKKLIEKSKNDEIQEEKKLAIDQISTIIENIEMMFYKLKKEESEIYDLAESINIVLNIDKINDENINEYIKSIKSNSKIVTDKLENLENIEESRKLNELLKDLKRISSDRNITIDYSEEMKAIFNKSFNKTIQKLISDSKLKKLELEEIEIEKEKCSFFSKILGKAKLKQAKLDNINLKKQLIISESQYADKLCYYLEDGLSDLYAYIKNEEDERCLSDIKGFLKNIESNARIKKEIDYDKLDRQIKEKAERQKNLPQLVLSKEKRKLFSKKQINLMEEKNNELKRVIQITRANSLKKQNTGIMPIMGNIKSTKSLSKFCHNLNEIKLSLQYQCKN